MASASASRSTSGGTGTSGRSLPTAWMFALMTLKPEVPREELSTVLPSEVRATHRDTSNYFRVFYVRRACRILPLYVLMVGLFLFFRQWPVSDRPQFAWVAGQPFPTWSYATFT